MRTYLVPILVSLVLAVLFRLSARAKPIHLGNGAILLQYSKPIRVFGIGFPLLLLAFFAFVAANTPPSSSNGFDDAALLLCFPLPFLAYFYLEFFKVKIVIDKKAIRATTPWQGRREYAWSEIEEVSYSPAFRWFRLRARNKKTLYISALITGVNEFIGIMSEELPESIYRKAIDKCN